MKVLERKKWWILNCSNCKSKLEAEPEDVKLITINGDYLGGGDSEYAVQCPCCGEYMIVPPSKLTAKIKDLVRNKK